MRAPQSSQPLLLLTNGPVVYSPQYFSRGGSPHTQLQVVVDTDPRSLPLFVPVKDRWFRPAECIYAATRNQLQLRKVGVNSTLFYNCKEPTKINLNIVPVFYFDKSYIIP